MKRLTLTLGTLGVVASANIPSCGIAKSEKQKNPKYTIGKTIATNKKAWIARRGQ